MKTKDSLKIKTTFNEVKNKQLFNKQHNKESKVMAANSLVVLQDEKKINVNYQNPTMTTTLKGEVTYVNHEKNFVTISYTPLTGGKEKTVNGQVDTATQKKLQEQGLVKKLHNYHVGDTVLFTLELSMRGDKQIATNILYQHNVALGVLLNKAITNYEFTGYIKIVDTQFFVKEIESYRFIPLQISAWQQPFTDAQLTHPVQFTINDITKKEKITATLITNNYIAEYGKAMQAYKNKKPVTATVFLVNEHAVFVHLYSDKIQAKLPLLSFTSVPNIGDVLSVNLSYLTPQKIVITL